MLYFNYAAVDPVLTNEKCSFWHFRWDANSDIKMEALTNYMKGVPDIKKVYLINQDYSFGQSVRTHAKAMLKAKRPDIQIVGDELHPLLKITDFAPYIAKIKASGADTVITGNWGQDIALLLKAAADAGLQVNWYTYYAGGTGGPTAIKQAGLNHQVFQIARRLRQRRPQAVAGRSRRRSAPSTTSALFYPRAVNEMRMFAAGRRTRPSRSTRSRSRSARRHEVRGLRRRRGLHAQGRPPVLPADVRLLARRSRASKEPFDEEKTGWGWRTDRQDRHRRRPCCRPPARWNGRNLSTLRPRAKLRRIATDRETLVAGRRRSTVSSREADVIVLELIVISTLNGVLFGMLLFLMASGLTLIFSMMGVLNFAHASFYMLGAFFGFQISRWVGFWPALIAGAAAGRRRRRAGRALRPAQRAQARPRRRTAVHLRPGLRDRGSGADDLGQDARSTSACRRCWISRPSRSSPPTTPPSRCSCCWSRSRSSSACCWS